jgi:hypothetical protein
MGMVVVVTLARIDGAWAVRRVLVHEG